MSKIYDRGSVLAITVAFIVLTLAAHTLIFNIDYPYTGQDYHPDEGVWTAVGKRYFQKFFIERDYSYETWNSYRFGDFGTGSPVVGKYIIGAALFLTGVVDIETVFPGYEFSDSANWDDIKEQRPPENALEAARLPIQWMGIFSTLLVFLLTRELSNSWLIGLSAGMLFALHPLTLEYSQRAMMDIPLLFFSLLTLLLASLFLARIIGNRRLQLLAYAVGIGLSFGMAISIKVSAVVTLLIAASWGGDSPHMDIADFIFTCKKLSVSPIQCISSRLRSIAHYAISRPPLSFDRCTGIHFTESVPVSECTSQYRTYIASWNPSR